MLTVFCITVFDDLIFAVGVGIVLASILFAINVSKQMNIKIDEVEDEGCKSNESICDPQITIIHINGVFFFGSASQVISRIENYLERECIIIDCSSITSMDILAVFALEDILVRLKDKNIKTVLVLNSKETTINLCKLGLFSFISRNDITYNKESAISKIRTYLSKKNGHN